MRDGRVLDHTGHSARRAAGEPRSTAGEPRSRGGQHRSIAGELQNASRMDGFWITTGLLEVWCYHSKAFCCPESENDA